MKILYIIDKGEVITQTGPSTFNRYYLSEFLLENGAIVESAVSLDVKSSKERISYDLANLKMYDVTEQDLDDFLKERYKK